MAALVTAVRGFHIGLRGWYRFLSFAGVVGSGSRVVVPDEMRGPLVGGCDREHWKVRDGQ